MSLDVEVEAYRSYPQRWVMLALFSFCVCLNNAIWVAYTPIVDNAAETYDVSTSRVNLFASCYLVTTVIFVPLGSWICDSKGVRWIIILGGLCNIIGAWVKYGSGVIDDKHTKYWVAFVGQVICSLGQPLYEPAPPKLAALWFTNLERSLATGIGTLAGVSGLAVGYGLSIGLVNRDDPDHAVGTINLTMAIMVTVPSILGIIFYKEHPPTPASPSAESSRESFMESVKKAVRHGPFVTILCTIAPGYGAATALFSLIGDLAGGEGYSDLVSGLIGVVLILSGLVGAVIFGRILDRTKQYLLLARVGFGCAAVTTFLFVISLTQHFPAPVVLLFVAMNGFVMLALLPICIELGVEVTYPCAEGVVAGSIKFLGNLYGLIFFFVVEFFISVGDGDSGWALWFVFFVSVSCAIGGMFSHGRYRRKEYEDEREHKNEMGVGIQYGT